MKGQWTRNLTGPGALRLTLALIVFVHHLSRIAIGAASVDVFFVLSGFWISRMWDDRYEHASKPYLTYLASRLWRLLPVFLLVTAAAIFCDLMLLGLSAPFTPHEVFSNLFIIGYASLSFQPVVPAWSLDIEFQFYVLAPALIWLARRSAVLTGAVALILSGIGAALGWHTNLMPFLVFFMIGILAERSNFRPSAVLAIGLLCAVALTLLALVVSPWRGILLGGAHPGSLFFLNPTLNVALAIGIAPYALWTTGRRGGALDPAFADLSYLIYLIHWIAVAIIARYVALLPTLPRFAMTGAAVVATLVVSIAVWAVFDRPINRARGRWVRSRVDQASASVFPARVL